MHPQLVTLQEIVLVKFQAVTQASNVMNVHHCIMQQGHFVLVGILLGFLTYFFKFIINCNAACDCNLSGVTDDGSCWDAGTACDVVPGECSCSQTYSGTKCDLCISGYYKIGNLCSRKKEIPTQYNFNIKRLSIF